MANDATPQVDVYSYAPTKISYKFSFEIIGIGAVSIAGVAYNPRSND
jgi:hypothetical protein